MVQPSRSIRPGPAPKRTTETSAHVRKRPKLLPLEEQGLTGDAERVMMLFDVVRPDEADDEDAYSNEDEGEDDDPWTDDEDVVKRRRSYTREHKLAAIAFAFWVDLKYADGSVGPISRYAAAKKLGITTAMMCKWIKARDAIADTKKGTRKHVPQRTSQEPALELQLTALFKAKRESGRQVNARWFFRDARIIYGAIYPERVTVLPSGRKLYNAFKFSYGWFTGYKRRQNTTPRAVTKKAQKAPEELRETILRWLRFNRRNSQPLPGQVTAEVGRYQLSEITNMDQSPIAYEFLSAKSYSFKGEKTIWTKTSRSGWDKRQATLQIRFTRMVFAAASRCSYSGANMTTIARQERPNYNDITKEW